MLEKQSAEPTDRFDQLEQSLRQEREPLVAGKYRLEKIIGQGGMGRIYLAHQAHLDRKVAIKLMIAAADQDATERFKEEASVTAKLSHPNTIRIFDFGVMEADVFYLVMEYIQGANIKQQLRKQGAIPPMIAAKLISDVCGALAEAHEKGIVHRDIKPGNIMMVEHREGVSAKLLDFGLVKSLNGSRIKTKTGVIIGSPMYMSPEQVENKGVCFASDIYSLGLTFYNMLTNTHPFQEDSLSAYFTAHLLKYPRSLEEVRPELKAYPALQQIINVAIQKDPRERFQTAEQLKQALGQFLEAPTLSLEINNMLLAQNDEISAVDDAMENATRIDLRGKSLPQRKSKEPEIERRPSWQLGLGLFILLGLGAALFLLQAF